MLIRFICLISISILSTFVASPSRAKSARCFTTPCFLDDYGGPRKGRECREDGTDVYYERRLFNPPPQSPPRCVARPVNAGPRVRAADFVAASYPRVLGSINDQCVARAMQTSPAVAGTMTYCQSPTDALNTKSRPLHCPTPRLVVFLRGWLNAALQCVNPTSFNQWGYDDLFISSEVIFGIVAHESRFNMNAASVAGKGLMQLTTPAVREFYNGKTNYHRKFWDMSKNTEACKEFRPYMENPATQISVDDKGRVESDWACKMTAPESIPRQLIVGITNLYLCRQEVQNVLDSAFNFSRLKSANEGSIQQRLAEKQEVADDLLLACHNWGAGNMKKAMRKIAPLSFKNADELRAKLMSTSRGGGRSVVSGSSIPTFPQKIRQELEALRRGDPRFGQRPLQSCLL